MDLSAARRMLLGPCPWLVDTYSRDQGKLRVLGWALPEYETPQNFTFTVNGVPAKDLELGLYSPDVARVFPFFCSSMNARFRLVHELTEQDLDLGYAAVDYCNAFTLEPIYNWHTIYIPLKSFDIREFPYDDQLQRTQGNTSRERFIIYGYTTYRRIESILQIYFRKSLNSFSRILDWGCGCGRVSRHLTDSVPRLHDCDIDPLNIRYCSENIAGGKFDVVALMPPTSYPDGYFDLIIGISVFTHLTGKAAQAWAGEIARIIQPGGVALMTVHGNSAIARFKEDSKLIEIFGTTFLDGDLDPALEKIISDKAYYRSTYHLASRVRNDFSKYFTVVDIIKASNALIQDFIVLLKAL